MDVLLPILLLAGIVVTGIATTLVTRARGILAGLVIPIIAISAAVVRGQSDIGHAEEAMGRGLEMMFFWLPVAISALIGFVIGVISHRSRKSKVPSGQ